MKTGKELISEVREMLHIDKIIKECEMTGKSPGWVDSARGHLADIGRRQPRDRINALALAGALIAGEIDRLSRQIKKEKE